MYKVASIEASKTLSGVTNAKLHAVVPLCQSNYFLFVTIGDWMACVSLNTKF